MEIPRPNFDTGFGFHDCSNAYWKPDDYEAYARMLRDHGATWFLMWAFDENKAPWARVLLEHGIEVILRLGPAYMPRPNIDVAHLDAYRAAGVRWAIFGNEYNLHQEWSTDDNWKSLDKPIRHIADWYVRMADLWRSKGGWPLTPPPSLGGHWLHRDWFERFMYALQNIAAEQGRSMESLLYPGGIGIHCRSLGNPLEDGPEDYDCSAREWEWFDATVKRFVGHSLPMANTEWGDEPGWCRRLNPNFDNRQKWDWWYNRNIEQIEWCNPASGGYKYPDYVFANCFWILHSPPPWQDCGLLGNVPYRLEMGGSDNTPLWDALPGIVTWNRSGGVPAPPPIPEPEPEPEEPMEIEGAELIQKYNLTIEPCTLPGFRVIKLAERCEANNCDVFLLEYDGTPLPNFAVRWAWPESVVTSYTDSEGRVGFAMSKDAYYDPAICGGPHWTAAGVTNSDIVRGIGMIAGTVHCTVNITFRYFEEAEPEPEPQPEPQPKEFTIFDACARYGIDLIDDRVKCGRYAKPDKITKRLPRGWNGIVVHHTASELVSQTPESIAKYHCKSKWLGGRGYNSIAYHFLLDFQNEWHFTAPVSWVTTHTGTALVNSESVGICVMGDYTKREPSPETIKQLRRMVVALRDWLGRSGQPIGCYLLPHCYVNDTACPGSIRKALVWN